MALYMCQVLHVVDFLGSRWMETAPTSIEVLLRSTQSQSDEPSDLRGSLSPTMVYTAPGSPRRSPTTYEPGATSLNFSDRADIDERTPYSVYVRDSVVWIVGQRRTRWPTIQKTLSQASRGTFLFVHVCLLNVARFWVTLIECHCHYDYEFNA